jgi:transposase InsO family protein
MITRATPPYTISHANQTRLPHLGITKLGLTMLRIGILREDKGGEFSGNEWDEFLREQVIRREHSIRDTPQQLGVAERFNRTLSEGITTIAIGSIAHLSEDAANHFVYGRIRLPSQAMISRTSYELFYGKEGTIERPRPFGCLAYVQLQKDERGALLPHAVFHGYPIDYKRWRFWNPQIR